MRRLHLVPLLVALAAVGQAADYTVWPLPESGMVRVSVKLDRPAGEFRMPAWAPGDYQLFNYGLVVEQIEFRRGGNAVSAERTTDVNLWLLPAGADEAIYTVKPSRGNFTVNLRSNLDHTFISGPGVLGWFEGDIRNRQSLFIKLEPGQIAESTLDPSPRQRSGFAGFVAPDYDELIDAPLVVGASIRTEAFEVRGKPMKVVGFNQVANADLASFVKVGAAAAEACFDLFGELPYPRYTFYCDFGGGGGGLEHLNSTRLGLPRGVRGEQMVGFIFHEFVHAFNVKRIREVTLGPFDYTGPVRTETLWWLEGVTDYYADVLAVRAGLKSRDAFQSGMARSLSSFARNPNRLKVSAMEASLRVWETRGSGGYGGVNYYQKGKLIGICLDLAIRGESKGKASLDDVIRSLYEECKGDKPGYEPGRIRELCIKFGGPELGRIYDICVKQAVDLPIDEVAAMCGLVWTEEGFEPHPDAPASLRAVGQAWPQATHRP